MKNYLGVKYRSVHQEKLIKLEEESWLWKDQNKRIYLDIKEQNDCSNDPGQFQLFIDAIHLFKSHFENTNQVELIVITDMWIDQLTDEGFKTYYCTDSKLEIDETFQNHPGVYGICTRLPTLDKDEIANYRSHGKKVIVYQVNSPKGAEKTREIEPDGLISDDIVSSIIEINR